MFGHDAAGRINLDEIAGHRTDAEDRIILRPHAPRGEPLVQVRRLAVRPAGADENAALPIPIFGEQLQVALGEIKTRPEDRDHARVLRDLILVGQLQRLELQVLPREVFTEFPKLGRLAVVFAMGRDEVELVLLRLRELDQRAREDLLASEAGHLGLTPLTDRQLGILVLGEVRAVHELVSSVIDENHNVLPVAKSELRLQFLRPYGIRIRIDFLDRQLALGGKLVFAQQRLGIHFRLTGGCEHHDRLHGLFEPAEQRLRLRAEGDVLSVAPIPSCVVFGRNIPVQQIEADDQDGYLHNDIDAHLHPSDACAGDIFSFGFIVLFHGS